MEKVQYEVSRVLDQFCVEVSLCLLVSDSAFEMTYIVSGGALNSISVCLSICLLARLFAGLHNEPSCVK